MHEILEHKDIPLDLAFRLERLEANYVNAFMTSSPKSGDLLADLYADLLAGRTVPGVEGGGEAAANRIAVALTEEAERYGGKFWGTPLGRACGWWLGGLSAYSDGGVARTIAAGMLGVSRQRALELIQAGRLDPQNETLTGVTRTALRREMQERYPGPAS